MFFGNSKGHAVAETYETSHWWEERAKHMQRVIKNRNRTAIVCFGGTPSAGKTTLIKECDRFFRRCAFTVYTPQEGAEAIRSVSRATPLYNLATFHYTMNVIIHEHEGHNYDLVLVDRDIYDSYCWMEYWLAKGKLGAKEKALFQAFILSRFNTELLDASFMVVCDADVAVKREHEIALLEKLGETTNPESLRRMLGLWKGAFETLKPGHPKLQLLDTTALDRRAMVREGIDRILKVFE